jgi:hypothetical protein
VEEKQEPPVLLLSPQEMLLPHAQIVSKIKYSIFGGSFKG